MEQQSLKQKIKSETDPGKTKNARVTKNINVSELLESGGEE